MARSPPKPVDNETSEADQIGGGVGVEGITLLAVIRYLIYRCFRRRGVVVTVEVPTDGPQLPTITPCGRRLSTSQCTLSEGDSF